MHNARSADADVLVDAARRLVVATEDAYDLAEGPLWDPVRSVLLWVDITAGRVQEAVLRPGGTLDVVGQEQFGGTVGAVAIGPGRELLAAVGGRLVVRSRDGDRSFGPELVPGGSGRRLNDGKPDPAGRFVVGTLALDGTSESESLMTVAGDETVRTLDDDLSLANGLAWSADGTLFYTVDTLRQTVFVRPYDVESGATGPRSVFTQLDHGFPDGICVDGTGCVWVAVWGAGAVNRYSSDGSLLDVIDVPAPHVSSVAFAGADLETLVITTAKQDLSRDQLRAFPLSGRLFTCVPGPRGLLQPRWAGPIPADDSSKGQ